MSSRVVITELPDTRPRCMMCGTRVPEDRADCPSCGERRAGAIVAPKSLRIPITRSEVASFRTARLVISFIWGCYSGVLFWQFLARASLSGWTAGSIFLAGGAFCLGLSTLILLPALWAVALNVLLAYILLLATIVHASGLTETILLPGALTFIVPVIAIVSQVLCIHLGYRMLNIGQRLRLAGLPLSTSPHDLP